MGWTTGTPLMIDLIHTLKREIEDKDSRERIYIKMIDSFELYDWNTQPECLGIDEAFDTALEKMHSSWFKKDEYMHYDEGLENEDE